MWKSAGRAPSKNASFTLALALQLRKKHGKTSVRLRNPQTLQNPHTHNIHPHTFTHTHPHTFTHTHPHTFTHTHTPTHIHPHTYTHTHTHTYTHAHTPTQLTLTPTHIQPHTHTLQNNIKPPQYSLKTNSAKFTHIT
jgi:hypothetical protein